MQHSSKTVTIDLEMADQKYAGTILGGIYVRKDIVKKSADGYTNRFNYVTPVLLKQNDDKVAPSLKLKKVKLTTQDLVSTINANILNVNMAYTDDLQTVAKIYPKAQKNKVIVTDKQTNRSVAPNSDFYYKIPAASKKLKPGTYVLDLKISSAKEKKEWHWYRTFKITASDAQAAAKISYKNSSIPTWIWIVLTILILLLLILLVLLLKKKKQNNN